MEIELVVRHHKKRAFENLGEEDAFHQAILSAWAGEWHTVPLPSSLDTGTASVSEKKKNHWAQPLWFELPFPRIGKSHCQSAPTVPPTLCFTISLPQINSPNQANHWWTGQIGSVLTAQRAVTVSVALPACAPGYWISALPLDMDILISFSLPLGDSGPLQRRSNWPI